MSQLINNIAKSEIFSAVWDTNYEVELVWIPLQKFKPVYEAHFLQSVVKLKD